MTVKRQGILDAKRAPNLKSPRVNFRGVRNTDKLDGDLKIVYDRLLQPDVGITKLLFVEGAYVAANKRYARLEGRHSESIA